MTTTKKPLPPKKKSTTTAMFVKMPNLDEPVPVCRNIEKFQIDNCNVQTYRNTGERHLLVPRETPYLFDESQLREISWAVWPHDGGDPSPVLLVGPKGCGKTSIVTQLASRCNMPVYRTNLTIGTSVQHLKGRRGAKDGSTVFFPGVVVRAMEEGAWLILDEVSGATPNVAMSLFPILEPDGEVYLEEAEPQRYVRRHPDFRVFMTDNVIGAAQEENRFSYAGTNPDVNEALLDRIHSTIQCGYPPPAAEHAIVRARLKLGNDWDDHIKFVIVTANKIRANPGASAFSMRMTLEWVRRIVAGRVDAGGVVYTLNPDQVLAAADSAFLLKMRSAADRDLVHEVVRRQIAEISGG